MDISAVQNEDGSYTLTIEGKTVKAVKASDLMGLKEKLERQVSELQAQIAEANRVKDETHTTLLQERAAKEQLESKLQESAILAQQVAELGKRAEAAETRSKQLEGEVTTNRVARLASLTGKPVDTFKDKTPDQLKSIEDALALAGFQPTPAKPKFDGSAPGGVEGKTPVGREKEKAELALARELAKKSPRDKEDTLW